MRNNYKKTIKLVGVKTHGLKNIDVEIPHDQITVVTGLSGSGKSSLAIDTLFAEGQRRYLESLSSYARQFLNKFEKPEFEKITGLRPSIAIEQKTQGYNPRSTIGTVTEIYDYLRILYARIGKAYSPYTGQELIGYSSAEITNYIFEKKFDEFEIISPIVQKRKGALKFEITKLYKEGISEVIIDNQRMDIITAIACNLDKNEVHTLEACIGSFSQKNERYEIELACNNALNYSNGLIKILHNNQETMLSKRAMCLSTGFTVSEQSPRLFSFNNPIGACEKCFGIGYLEDDFEHKVCTACKGSRLNIQALCIKIDQKNIADICKMSLQQAYEWINNLKLTEIELKICESLVNEISKRLKFLLDVGLYYLTLERSAQTLSGGESQRIRLASQIGSGLEGVLYILDEPSIGLHPQDQEKLINTLRNLRDLGNTIVMVEHDEDTMLCADYIVEMGPRAGIYGGEVVYSGTLEDLKKTKTITAEYLNKIKKIEVIDKYVCKSEKKLIISNAKLNNLKNVQVEIPLNCMVGVCGVSGSGKSTLIMEVLTHDLKNKLNGMEEHFCKLSGDIIPFEVINQAPIGRTTRSIPATYTGIMDDLRIWYASLAESKNRGYTASRFSFNVEGGRCKKCNGEGVRYIEMHFLPNIEIQCEDCLGKRFNAQTCEIKYNGLSIADVLNLSVKEALDVFSFIPSIKLMLQTLCDVHLGYIKLGQNATTLSGGEAQRIKLAKILGSKKKNVVPTLYILDEPTTGLHFDDINALLQVLNRLVKQNHSVVVIEHHIDMLKNMDHLIELGYEGGKNGGQIIASGTWEELKKKNTATGRFF